MKIAVTSTGTNLDSEVDPRFGRAPYFIIVDSESFSFEVLDNKENVNALKGAGIQAAGMVSNKGADILLTGHCGPNAMKVFKAARIKVANNAQGSVRDAVTAFIDGKLPLADEADVEGQW
ncbi:MAG: NifB/NifX family molybdenum-iron cluster-binding protein [Deltaproteobacteria bacterium]|nr:NifB/NifX family molybdenum-iron cluster-binding protein [Deltaproteobacteria bacterium]